MAHLVIDGYNYLNRIRTSPVNDGSNLDMLRRSILDRLSRYKRQRGAKITVVFDAYNSFSPNRQRESFKGVDVVYSKQGETADDVIIEWIREKRAGMIVVSSDRAIIDEAKQYGIAFITPSKMDMLIAEEAFGKDIGKDEEEAYQEKKKGNPRKLPKKLRRATKAVGKI